MNNGLGALRNFGVGAAHGATEEGKNDSSVAVRTGMLLTLPFISCVSGPPVTSVFHMCFLWVPRVCILHFHVHACSCYAFVDKTGRIQEQEGCRPISVKDTLKDYHCTEATATVIFKPFIARLLKLLFSLFVIIIIFIMSEQCDCRLHFMRKA